MLAKNQGKFGQAEEAPSASDSYASFAGTSSGGSAAKKIFVGSLPDSITEVVLREEFSQYGQITELFLKTGCASGKQWAFISYASGEEASVAKNSADRITSFPGSDKPVEVMLARNQ